ncbi:hypothetical protein QJS10_CPA06g00477 [Acorus calamus]|uniref:Uncharacterized protein n=1 Tax=Acorus calamus TaxID=4465 RepID=A0AAV9EJN9_ACOCL|nr:hypothetical protein QJS10_CPA06g00477 [Acorus calamus]
MADCSTKASSRSSQVVQRQSESVQVDQKNHSPSHPPSTQKKGVLQNPPNIHPNVAKSQVTHAPTLATSTSHKQKSTIVEHTPSPSKEEKPLTTLTAMRPLRPKSSPIVHPQGFSKASSSITGQDVKQTSTSLKEVPQIQLSQSLALVEKAVSRASKKRSLPCSEISEAPSSSGEMHIQPVSRAVEFFHKSWGDQDTQEYLDPETPQLVNMDCDQVLARTPPVQQTGGLFTS